MIEQTTHQPSFSPRQNILVESTIFNMHIDLTNSNLSFFSNKLIHETIIGLDPRMDALFLSILDAVLHYWLHAPWPLGNSIYARPMTVKEPTTKGTCSTVEDHLHNEWRRVKVERRFKPLLFITWSSLICSLLFPICRRIHSMKTILLSDMGRYFCKIPIFALNM